MKFLPTLRQTVALGAIAFSFMTGCKQEDIIPVTPEEIESDLPPITLNGMNTNYYTDMFVYLNKEDNADSIRFENGLGRGAFTLINDPTEAGQDGKNYWTLSKTGLNLLSGTPTIVQNGKEVTITPDGINGSFLTAQRDAVYFGTTTLDSQKEFINNPFRKGIVHLINIPDKSQKTIDKIISTVENQVFTGKYKFNKNEPLFTGHYSKVQLYTHDNKIDSLRFQAGSSIYSYVPNDKGLASVQKINGQDLVSGGDRNNADFTNNAVAILPIQITEGDFQFLGDPKANIQTNTMMGALQGAKLEVFGSKIKKNDFHKKVPELVKKINETKFYSTLRYR